MFSVRTVLLFVSVLFGFLLLTVPSGEAGAKGFTAHDLARLRTVGSVSISPDGQAIAYTLSVPRAPLSEDDGADWVELHVVDGKGSSRPFVAGEVNVSHVDWTPDGSGISFLAKRPKDEHKSLYVIPVDGGEARKVVAHETDIAGYSFGPDGARVAFLAKEAESKERRELKKRGAKAEIYEEDDLRVRVWMVALDGAGAEPVALELAGAASELHWSPNGSMLAVAIAPTPLVDDDLMKRALHVVDAASAKVIARFDNRGKLGAVAWSPDAKHLAYLGVEDVSDPLPGRLMVIPAKGGKPRDLIPGFAGHFSSIAWQDAKTVMFTANEGTSSCFGEIRIDGSGRKTHVPAGNAVLLDKLDLSRDGQAAVFLGHTPAHPPEVYLSSHGSPSPRRLTTSNPWLDEIELAPQEVVRHKARDGLDLEGVLIRPLGTKKGKRVPLILMVHGGPENHTRHGWVTSYGLPGQVAAARGFAVFYPNYRASTGRGVEFSKLDHGDPAGREFDDLVDAVDHLVSIGLADKSKVGITGRSYGGYASAWGATYYSERFAAAVMGVGLSDLVSFSGTTDIPNEMYEVHWRRWAWEDWQATLERSPIYHAQKSKTPTLILHGKDDPRVHPSQSLELYRNLKLSGKAPVRLVLYPGEKHANKAATARLDYTLRLVNWMEHYLKGPGGEPPPYDLDYEEPGTGSKTAGKGRQTQQPRP